MEQVNPCGRYLSLKNEFFLPTFTKCLLIVGRLNVGGFPLNNVGSLQYKGPCGDCCCDSVLQKWTWVELSWLNAAPVLDKTAPDAEESALHHVTTPAPVRLEETRCTTSHVSDILVCKWGESMSLIKKQRRSCAQQKLSLRSEVI